MAKERKSYTRYQVFKDDVNDFLKTNRLFRLLIELAVVISLIVVAIDFFAKLKPPYDEILYIVDLAIVVLFSAEYLVRLWASGRGFTERLRYAITPEAIIDLVAIAPVFRFMRLMRLLRLLRLLRLVKLARYNDKLLRSLNGLLAGLNDNTFMVAAVMVVILAVILLGAFTVNLVDPTRSGDGGFIHDLIWSTYAVFDFGAGYDGVDSVAGRLISMALSMFGLAVFGIVVGIITSSIISYFINIREGLMESTLSDHIIICGWNDEVANMIDALDGYRDVVILAEKDADETDIRQVQRMDSIQYVYGDATDRDCLIKAGIGRCHHVIIVRDSSKLDRSDHDARALMIILSVRSLETENGREFGEIPIATELSHTDSFEHLKFPALRNVHVVGGSSIAAQMLIQTVFNPDIVSIYNSFLYRPGSEIYTILLDHSLETTFAEFADAVFEKGSIALGYIRDDTDVINPDRNSVMQSGDRAILISDDQESAAKSVRSAIMSLRK